MILEKSIMVIGEIGSGKTTIARYLANVSNYKLIGFGEFLKTKSSGNLDRKTLQDLGEALIRKDPETFLDDVIKTLGDQKTKLIFDGVRHLSIFEAIRKCSQETCSIFIETTYEQRLTRYFSRKKEIDNTKKTEIFNKISNHTVEHETVSLKVHSNFIIKSSNDQANDLEQARILISPFLK